LRTLRQTSPRSVDLPANWPFFPITERDGGPPPQRVHPPFIYHFLYWTLPMPRFLFFAGLAVACLAFAQSGAPSPNTAPVKLTARDALNRARANQSQPRSALTAQTAHEDAVQARAALLATAQSYTRFIYMQPNGAPTGVFVSNDDPRVYNNRAQAHADIYAPVKRSDNRRAMAAEAAAKAMADLAARGLAGTVPGITALRKNLKKRPNWRRLSESNEFLESRC
jgi:hypothetical protein